jgi:hypothetical protein
MIQETHRTTKEIDLKIGQIWKKQTKMIQPTHRATEEIDLENSKWTEKDD